MILEKLKDGITIIQINISFNDSACSERIKEYFDKKLTEPGNLGKGVLSYDGFWNEERTVFLGLNHKLNTFVLTFAEKLGMIEFETFRKDFLNLTVNQAIASKLSISNLKAVYILNPPSMVETANQLSPALEEIVQIQQKTVPKVLIDSGNLYIGGKTGHTSLQITSITGADLKVNKMVTSLKLKDRSGASCMALVLSSIETDCYTIVAFLMIKQMSRLNSTKLLTSLCESLRKNYEVGKVSNYAQVKERSSTSSGKYVNRVFSALTKKLTTEETSVETQSLFINWMSKLYNEEASNIKEGTTFFADLKNTCVGTPTGKKTKRNARKSSMTREQFFQKTIELPTEESPKK